MFTPGQQDSPLEASLPWRESHLLVCVLLCHRDEPSLTPGCRHLLDNKKTSLVGALESTHSAGKADTKNPLIMLEQVLGGERQEAYREK